MAKRYWEYGRLHIPSLAITIGLIWGLAIFGATLWVVGRGGGNTLYLLRKFYLGYSVTVTGAFVGLFWGLLDGAVVGSVFGLIYNTVNERFRRSSRLRSQ